jgi:hypothetical protein
VRLDEEKAQFAAADGQTFDALKVPIGIQGRVSHFSTDGVESVFIVARKGSRVLFFDDVEDEFATGTIDEWGNITNAGLCGELVYALRNLVEITA